MKWNKFLERNEQNWLKKKYKITTKLDKNKGFEGKKAKELFKQREVQITRSLHWWFLPKQLAPILLKLELKADKRILS